MKEILMLGLQSASILMAHGWEHISNLGSHAEAVEIKKQLELGVDAYEYKIGYPKGGVKYSNQMLKSMGMVGLYRRGGRTVLSNVLPTPSIPVCSDTPVPQTIPIKPKVGQPHDRPLKPVMAEAA